MDEKTKKALSALQALCSKQECCSHDIYSKALKRLEGDEEAAAEIMAELVREKYVDDSRYAASFAREKSSIAGWGPVKIRHALSAKGIARSVADDALREIDPERSEARMEKLLTAKWRLLKEDPQGRLKLIRYALSRGYEYSQIENLLRNL